MPLWAVEAHLASGAWKLVSGMFTKREYAEQELKNHQQRQEGKHYTFFYRVVEWGCKEQEPTT